MPKRKTLTKSSRFDLENRSDSYQYKVKEIPWDFTTPPANNTNVYQWSNRDSISGRLNRYVYSEELLDLKDALLERFWQVANEVLTPSQLKVLVLYSEGYTQTEIAKKLGWKQQNAVHRAIFGSKLSKTERANTSVHKNNLDSNYHGGAIKKLKAAFLEDTTIQNLLQQIEDNSEEIL